MHYQFYLFSFEMGFLFDIIKTALCLSKAYTYFENNDFSSVYYLLPQPLLPSKASLGRKLTN